MSDRPRPLWGILLAVTVLLEAPGCAVLTYGTSQKVPVTCAPPGALVYVDGARVGEAPVALSLKKKTDHTIRIEKPGYQPVVIEITRKRRSSYSLILAEDVILCALGGFYIGAGLTSLIGNAVAPREFDAGRDLQWMFIVGLAGSLIVPFVSINADTRSGSLNELSPGVIEVSLTPVDATPGLVLLQVPSEHLDGLRWIRVICRGLD